MGDHLQVGKPSWYVTSHPGQLSLAIPPWVGARSTSESWCVNRHTTRCTSLVTLGTLFLIIWRTVLFLCLSSETSSNIFFSHRTSTPSTFEVITETRYINYLLTYLLVSMVWQCKPVSGWGLMKRRSAPLYGLYDSGSTLLFFKSINQSINKSSFA